MEPCKLQEFHNVECFGHAQIMQIPEAEALQIALQIAQFLTQTVREWKTKGFELVVVENQWPLQYLFRCFVVGTS